MSLSAHVRGRDIDDSPRSLASSSLASPGKEISSHEIRSLEGSQVGEDEDYQAGLGGQIVRPRRSRKPTDRKPDGRGEDLASLTIPSVDAVAHVLHPGFANKSAGESDPPRAAVEVADILLGKAEDLPKDLPENAAVLSPTAAASSCNHMNSPVRSTSTSGLVDDAGRSIDVCLRSSTDRSVAFVHEVRSSIEADAMAAVGQDSPRAERDELPEPEQEGTSAVQEYLSSGHLGSVGTVAEALKFADGDKDDESNIHAAEFEGEPHPTGNDAPPTTGTSCGGSYVVVDAMDIDSPRDNIISPEEDDLGDVDGQDRGEEDTVTDAAAEDASPVENKSSETCLDVSASQPETADAAPLEAGMDIDMQENSLVRSQEHDRKDVEQEAEGKVQLPEAAKTGIEEEDVSASDVGKGVACAAEAQRSESTATASVSEPLKDSDMDTPEDPAPCVPTGLATEQPAMGASHESTGVHPAAVRTADGAPAEDGMDIDVSDSTAEPDEVDKTKDAEQVIASKEREVEERSGEVEGIAVSNVEGNVASTQEVQPSEAPAADLSSDRSKISEGSMPADHVPPVPSGSAVGEQLAAMASQEASGAFDPDSSAPEVGINASPKSSEPRSATVHDPSANQVCSSATSVGQLRAVKPPVDVFTSNGDIDVSLLGMTDEEMSAVLQHLKARVEQSSSHVESLKRNCSSRVCGVLDSTRQKVASTMAHPASKANVTLMHAHGWTLKQKEASCDAYLEGQHSHNTMHFKLLHNRAFSHLVPHQH